MTSDEQMYTVSKRLNSCLQEHSQDVCSWPSYFLSVGYGCRKTTCPRKNLRQPVLLWAQTPVSCSATWGNNIARPWAIGSRVNWWSHSTLLQAIEGGWILHVRQSLELYPACKWSQIKSSCGTVQVSHYLLTDTFNTSRVESHMKPEGWPYRGENC